jgi:hypothetical protein
MVRMTVRLSAPKMMIMEMAVIIKNSTQLVSST